MTPQSLSHLLVLIFCDRDVADLLWSYIGITTQSPQLPVTCTSTRWRPVLSHKVPYKRQTHHITLFSDIFRPEATWPLALATTLAFQHLSGAPPGDGQSTCLHAWPAQSPSSVQMFVRLLQKNNSDNTCQCLQM